jgi:hypothetical protein
MALILRPGGMLAQRAKIVQMQHDRSGGPRQNLRGLEPAPPE